MHKNTPTDHTSRTKKKWNDGKECSSCPPEQISSLIRIPRIAGLKNMAMQLYKGGQQMSRPNSGDDKGEWLYMKPYVKGEEYLPTD
ncbi:hypothetical protein AUP68_14035 [Ilyonectria robusta]